MKHPFLSTLKIIFGVVLLLVGLVGNVLPIIPGLLFMAAGILLLAGEIPWVHRWLERMETRYPKIRSIMRHVKKKDGSINFQKIVIILIVVSLISAAVSYTIFKAT
jgi:uncharacterized membrane protein YbaN (DUF454 family)